MGFFSDLLKSNQDTKETLIPVEEEGKAEIPDVDKKLFVAEDIPQEASAKITIYTVYERLQEDYETRGYQNATNFPDTSYMNANALAILSSLTLLCQQCRTRYEDDLTELDAHISQARSQGLVQILDSFENNKLVLARHLAKLDQIERDIAEQGQTTASIVTTYKQGFMRGLAILSRTKVDSIMH